MKMHHWDGAMERYREYRRAFMPKQSVRMFYADIFSLFYALFGLLVIKPLFDVDEGNLQYSFLLYDACICGFLCVLGFKLPRYKKDFEKKMKYFEVMSLLHAAIYQLWGILCLWTSYHEARTINFLVYLLIMAIVVIVMQVHFMRFMAVLGLNYFLIGWIIARNGLPQREVCNVINFFLFSVVLVAVLVTKYYSGLATFTERTKREAVLKEREAFISNIAHEMRTPLNAILGKNQLILQNTTDEDSREMAGEIENTGKILLSLINDILDLSKIESGKMNIVPAQYDTTEITYGIAEIMETEARMKGLDMNVMVDEELPSKLYGDEVRVKQILINLLSNAIKYTKKGTITFAVKYEKQVDKACLTVSVKDTGMGIRAEDLPKLTQSFVRIDEKANRKTQGTGLGMSITNNLLHLMASELQVESVYGEGSTFSFVILQDIVDETPLEHEKKRGIRFEPSFKNSNLHILVVDDNKINYMVCEQFLKLYEINSTWASGGGEGLELMKESRYDLIFVDHQMPEMDGIEMLGEIRSRYPELRTPVVALTANESSESDEVYKGYGFDGYIGKPIDIKKLDKLLCLHLGQISKS